jgi:hypothetical protein
VFRLPIEHPRRALLFAVAALTMLVGVRVFLHFVADGPPANDQAALDELRTRFSQSAWEPSLVTAYWKEPDVLFVSLDREDRRLAMAACADLTDIVQTRISVGPGDVTYRIHYPNGILFIENQSNDIMASNLSNSAGCQWRLG